MYSNYQASPAPKLLRQHEQWLNLVRTNQPFYLTFSTLINACLEQGSDNNVTLTDYLRDVIDILLTCEQSESLVSSCHLLVRVFAEGTDLWKCFMSHDDDKRRLVTLFMLALRSVATTDRDWERRLYQMTQRCFQVDLAKASVEYNQDTGLLEGLAEYFGASLYGQAWATLYENDLHTYSGLIAAAYHQRPPFVLEQQSTPARTLPLPTSITFS